MTADAELPSYRRLAYGARTFVCLVVLIPGAAEHHAASLAGVLLLAGVWVVVSFSELILPSIVAVAIESAAIGLTCAALASLPAPVLVALMVPGFTSALRLGRRGLSLALSVETLAFVGLALAMSRVLTADRVTSLLTWLVAGVGLGLIGLYLRNAERASDPLRPYRDAQALIRELITLSGNLDGSLDALSPAHRIAARVADRLPVAHLQVSVPRHEALAAIVSIPDPMDVDLTLVSHLAWTGDRIVVDGATFAFPLRTAAGPVGVVAGQTAAAAADQRLVTDRVLAVAGSLDDVAVQLDTAMLFADLREAATTEERRRLAREMHDGVAQDIASLGYLVDALATSPASPEQARQLAMLRGRITEVVTEVRRSVQTLRTDAGASPSLGAAVSTLARHLSESSGIPIRVSLDEKTVRLRPEVEAELLRIAQEAMTNAVRHAEASLIEVHVLVSAPKAEIVVRDDGVGLKSPRPDSQGLQIMRERADLIGAAFDVSAAPPRGTSVTVRIGQTADASAPAEVAGRSLRG